jgi:hypothetical protein
MVVTEPVLNRDRQVLIPAGQSLTERHLRLFKIWGIADVEVVGGPKRETGDVDTAVRLDPGLRDLGDYIDELFRYVQDDELMMELKREVKKFLARGPALERPH